MGSEMCIRDSDNTDEKALLTVFQFRDQRGWELLWRKGRPDQQLRVEQSQRCCATGHQLNMLLMSSAKSPFTSAVPLAPSSCDGRNQGVTIWRFWSKRPASRCHLQPDDRQGCCRRLGEHCVDEQLTLGISAKLSR